MALKGENFDGHRFVENAVAAGAAAVLVAKGEGGDAPNVIEVEDTLTGLQALAKAYRKHLGIKVVGITGSNGKTSTKDLIASVLRQQFGVSATKGNFNNHIGLPLTILSADESDQVGVWEMGMSNPGEIAALAEIAGPDAGVITNVGVAHIEHMGSREAIAAEKGSLAEAVPAGGFVVLNAEDDYTAQIAASCESAVVTAGVGAGDFHTKDLRATAEGSAFVIVAPDGEQAVELPVPGRHMVGNALLAAAVGVQLGVSLEKIAAGLASVELTGGRLARREIGGVGYIDDSYNANPDSVLAAIETLAGLECAGRRFAVLGGMAELGELSEAEHQRIGKAAAGAGIDFILSVGDVARPVVAGVNGSAPGHVEHFENAADCAAFLSREAGEGDLVLVKGSRSSAMEQIFTSLDTE